MLALAALLLAGCAAPRALPPDREAEWAERRERLAGLKEWHAEGRIAVRGDGESGTVNFRWRDASSGGFRLQLEGPVGQAVGRLEVDRGRAMLTTRDGTRHVGSEPSRLVRSVFGWRIPVAALRDWLVGLPAGSDDYRLDRYGRLAGLTWRAWEIDYRRYRQVEGLDLPARLRADNPGIGTQIRVAIDHWRLEGEAGPPVDESPVPLIGG